MNSREAFRPIGVFDSGVGGLTVVSAIRRVLPAQPIIYFGDTARLPYGNKSARTVERYSLEIARFLVAKGVRFLVVACNTSSSLALGALERTCGSLPVLGMIQPGARAAVEATRNNKIGIIGTRATVQSGAYEREVRKLSSSAIVFSRACPLFVPLVEEGWAEDRVAEEVAARYLEPLLAKGIDTLVLGCTHYPVLEPVISRVAGPSVTLISSSEAAATMLASRLEVSKNATRPSERAYLRCFVTDAGTYFKEVAERILGEPLASLEAIDEERLVAQ